MALPPGFKQRCWGDGQGPEVCTTLPGEKESWRFIQAWGPSQFYLPILMQKGHTLHSKEK